MAEYKSPQQEPGTERRLLLIFAATFLIILLFQPLLKKYGPQPPAPKPENTQPAQNQPQQPPMTPRSATNAPASEQTHAAAIAPKAAASESETVVENDLYRIVFTNHGARVKSWVLKKYKDKPDGNPLELVNTAAEKYGYPLSLWSYDENLRNKINSALYVVESSGSRAPAEINFEYADGDTVVRKRFKFDDSYVVEVHTSVEVNGATVSAFPMWPAGFGDQTTLPPTPPIRSSISTTAESSGWRSRRSVAGAHSAAPFSGREFRISTSRQCSCRRIRRMPRC